MGVPSVMILPLLVVVFAGVYYLYNEIIQFMSKSIVRNKVVVITDAVSGMGSECARMLHEGGARLVLCGPSWDKLESLYDSLCSGADPSKTFTPKLVLLDFSDIDSMEEVITEIGECYGCVDVLIFNSSMKVKAPVQNLSLEMDKTVMDVNYFGPISLAKGILPLMISRRTGHFVLVNSIQGRLAVPYRSSYAPSKHAVQAFFDCLRAEVEEYGISVSTISHTFINATTQNPAPSDSQPKNALWAYNDKNYYADSPTYLQQTGHNRLSCSDSANSNSLTQHSKIGCDILRMVTTHGVNPKDLAGEIVKVVNGKRREVLLAHPIPWTALYIRSLMPSFFFAVVAAGVRDGPLAEQLK